MKNKKVVYILLPVALLIWGIIIYRIVGALETPVEEIEAVRSEAGPGLAAFQPVDTFHLELNYRDPFLRKAALPKAPVLLTTSGQNRRMVPKKEPLLPQPAAIIWPEVIYKGFIENKGSRKRIAMLQVGKIDHLVGTGQAVGDLTVLQVQADSIKVAFQSAEKYIKKMK